MIFTVGPLYDVFKNKFVNPSPKKEYVYYSPEKDVIITSTSCKKILESMVINKIGIKEKIINVVFTKFYYIGEL